MINPNWNVFKVKFSDNPQKFFEWFCYILFCKEFNKELGIFRYKNQSAIETDPIAFDGKTIGWQAKFYDTSLSNHTDELLSTIEKAKRDYPAITNLIIYTNQEWGQSKGKEPKGKTEVEQKAQALKIDLDWRTASYFESPFVSIKNELISKHFFALENSVFNLIEEQNNHTGNILENIKTKIIFNGSDIEIDRTPELEELNAINSQSTILSGIGGVGKTAVIKKLFELVKNKYPIYVYKASEFELNSIKEFFNGYSIEDFIEVHAVYKEKVIVIDSAEKLIDLKNTEPFKEFLSIFLKNNWKVIFTTRDNYLDDLNYELTHIYKISPTHISLRVLDSKEIRELSEQSKFSLPKDDKLFDYIKNPFYLNEYLRFYNDKLEINYIDFKNELWNRVILKSKPSREICFMKLAFDRANSGQFFITSNCETHILEELRNDGIIGYESPHGYFIAHDIHEEWALDKFIEAEFNRKSDDQAFFNNIGSSLAIRRAFRKWISEKLLYTDEQTKTFIEQALQNTEIPSYWKDEILVAVLLSEYSDKFFDIFKKELLSENKQLLVKLSFLLRIACKEVDDFFSLQGATVLEQFSLEFFLTKPKGQGWKSFIQFIFNNIDEIGIENIYFAIPIIYDWVRKFKDGNTTRYCGLLALKYYQWIIQEKPYFSNDERKNQLLQTIIYSSSEIKNELEEILKEIIANKWKNHNDPYYKLSKIILTKFETAFVCKILPSYVLQLADLFWTFTPDEHDYYNHHTGVDNYFGLEEEHLDYFPASSLQTPIYLLLQTALKETVDFILAFTNNAIEQFAKSEFAKHEIEEVDVFIKPNEPIKQYISTRLWCTYRGTQVSPHVLESMHMALEKYFLENGKDVDSDVLESWLIYLLKNSNSASISGLVASIVMAYPDKTFKVAEILFKTKEFFLYDTHRYVLDQTAKSTIQMLNNFAANARRQIYDNERLKACDYSHRKMALEHVFLHYQMFRSDLVTEDDANNRQKILYNILDDYYSALPDNSTENDGEQMWRLYLARMDRRKMNIETEETESGYNISFNPELDKDLKEYSEEAATRTSAFTKYTALSLWAKLKFKNEEKYKQYTKYENDPILALQEVKEIISKIRSETPTDEKSRSLDEGNFYLFNHAIPVEVCSVLIRYHFDQLSNEDVHYCLQLILDAATSTLKPDFKYSSIDGIDHALLSLPFLFEKFPDERERIKNIIIMNLFNEYSVDMYGTSFNVFSITAIQNLWKSYFDDAQSLLVGYLYLKPKYDELYTKIRKENYEKQIYNIKPETVFDRFLNENKEYRQKILKNQVEFKDIGNIESIDMSVLNTVFQMMPFSTDNEDHKNLIKDIIKTYAKKQISNDRDDRFENKYEFLIKLATFILNAPAKEIPEYLVPLLDSFKGSVAISDLFVEFISVEDKFNSYDNFWLIWNTFKEKIIKLCDKGDGYSFIDRVVRSYLFAQNKWIETATEWHTFKSENSKFFKEITEKIGHCPSTLYSISKMLDGIGSNYLDEGMIWISDMLKNNEILWKAKLEVNTIYYLENLVKKYIYRNKEKIKKNKGLKEGFLVILDYLIEHTSVVGYLARESIL